MCSVLTHPPRLRLQPTLDEIRLFGSTLDDTAAVGGFEHEEVVFVKGDRVVVKEGDLMNMEGYVVDVAESTVRIKIDSEELKVCLIHFVP